jgi:predicted ATPase
MLPLEEEIMQPAAANQRARKWGQRIAIVAFASSLLVGGEAFAQSASTFSQDFRLWTPVFLTVKLPSSFFAYMEVNPRFADLDDAGHIDQLLLRPALGYQLTDNLSIWQGYAWVGNYNQRHTSPAGAIFR